MNREKVIKIIGLPVAALGLVACGADDSSPIFTDEAVKINDITYQDGKAFTTFAGYDVQIGCVGNNVAVNISNWRDADTEIDIPRSVCADGTISTGELEAQVS
jgi:hypothetical protein